MENDNKKTDFGPMAGIIIVLAVLIIGAFYFAEQRIKKQKEFQDAINQAQIATTTATSSDEISDIENDINLLNIDSLGAEIDNL